MKLARAGKLPHIVLPDGEVRFDEDEITALLKQPKSEQEAAHA
jgi:predicted site-specific integrase-resolvase